MMEVQRAYAELGIKKPWIKIKENPFHFICGHITKRSLEASPWQQNLKQLRATQILLAFDAVCARGRHKGDLEPAQFQHQAHI